MTNHNPTITSSAATGSFTEDANTTGSTVDHVLSGTMNFTDSDHSDTHATTTTLKTAVWSGGSALPSGAFTRFQAGLTSSILTDSNGVGKLKWTFSEDDRDFDFLAKDETIVLTYDVTLTDNHGGSTKQTVKITITGTDDKPVFATTTGATLSEQANHSLSLSSDTAHIALQFTDVDLNNTGHTACVLSVSATGNTSGILPGSLGTGELMSFFDIDNVVKNSGSSNGTVNTTFSAPDLAFDYLAAGEQIQITYVVQIDDRKGGVNTQNVTVTVNGTNDKPVVVALPESAHLTEDHNLSGGNLTAHGEFLFSDLDLSDTHTVSTTVTAARSGGGTVPISNSDLIDAMGAVIDHDSTGQLLGDVDWNFALPNSAVGFLAEGETLTLNYHITVTDPLGASDTEDVCITVLGINKPVVTKVATVPGGTADHAGEVISYSISVANAGHSALTGITVTDPSVNNLAAVDVNSDGFNDGDTNHDNQLSAGETWQYTASYTVTQDDINTLGHGSGFIQNTATVDTAESLPVSASTAVVVENGTSISVTKTSDVSSVNAAGDVITYTIAVANTGNTTIASVQVDDSDVNNATPIVDPFAPVPGAGLLAQVLNGDYNVGDTNQNGFQDPGETFVFVNAGDTNQNGIQDPGETFLFTNIGDTNQNGFQDGVEVFQYYNAGDTNHNGVEDPGETFQFAVDHSATPVLVGGFNAGDTNHNGFLDVGETWQYTASYTVTQGDIDNGGVVQPGLTHDDTATVTVSGPSASDTHSVTIIQDPHVTLTKTATVADGTADAAGDVINYTIDVANAGNMSLTGVSVSDPSVSNLAAVMSGGFNTGDTNQDGKLSVGETWHYTAGHTVAQGDIDNGGVVQPGLTYNNTASVTTDQGAGDSDSASVPIVQSPHLTLDKTATVPGGTADTVGEVISYSINVSNDGNMTLTGVSVTDPSVTDLAAVMSGGFNTGDTNHDGNLNIGETWNYSASHTVTQGDIDAGGTINNTASVSTDQGASSNDSASVTVEHNAAMTLVKAALGYHDANSNNVADAGDTIDFSFMVNNTGNATLHQIDVADLDGAVMVTGTEIASLAPGASDSTSWAASYVITATDVSNGYHDNEAVATALETSAPSGTVHVVLAGLPLLV